MVNLKLSGSKTHIIYGFFVIFYHRNNLCLA
jgi:hypothetical protein